MSNILKLFDELKIPYARKGTSYVTRCPFCKGDDKIGEHNAQINVERNGFYCYTEGKFYNYKEILENLEASGDYDIEIMQNYQLTIQNRKSEIKENAEKLKSKPPADFEIVEKSFLEKGYAKTATFKYYLADGKFAYVKYRYEKTNEITQETEKTFLYENSEGKATLKGVVQKQIPYGLEQFFYLSPQQIWLVEGEKCRDILISNMPESNEDIACLSFIKPTDLNGFENIFENTDITIFEDNDETGKKNTSEIVEILKKFVKTIKVVKFEEGEKGYDVADFLETHTWEDLIEKIKKAEIIYQIPLKQLHFGIPDIKPTDNFILEPYIPKQAVVLFDGLGETGKTLLAMQLAMSLATGKPFLGFEIKEKQKVLYLTAEENDANFAQRLKLLAKGLNVNNEQLQQNFAWLSIYSENFQCSTYRLLKNANKEIITTEFYDCLVNIITHFKPSLVILDSLVNFYGLDENSSEQASIFMEALKMITKNHDCSFMLLHHQTKEAMRVDGEKLFRGSMVFREQSRARITLQRVSEDTKKLTIEKLNYYSPIRQDVLIDLATANEKQEPLLCFMEKQDIQKQESEVKHGYSEE